VIERGKGRVVILGEARKLRQELASLRKKGGLESREVEDFARALGRRRHSRGKEPAWVSDVPGLRPVSIPDHPGDLNRFTARGILNQLEEDLEMLDDDVTSESVEVGAHGDFRNSEELAQVRHLREPTLLDD